MARPVRIQLLVVPGSTPIVPVGLLDLLRKSDALAASLGATRTLDVALVAAAPRPTVRAAGGLALRCAFTLDSAPAADLVVVSPYDPELLEGPARDPATARFLRRAHRGGATLASVCTGAFVLAETGLLDGRPAATHWAFHDLFRARFPRVELRPQEILVDAGRFLSTGGATSFLNFALYLVERFHGHEVARAAARMFLIDEHKAPQGAYAIFSGQKGHGDAVILEAQARMERAAGTELSVEDVAAAVALSRRTFIRRFKAATGTTPLDYLQRARIETAKRALESTREPIGAVAAHAGYENLGAFRRLFLRHTGVTPSDYRARYARVAPAAPPAAPPPPRDRPPRPRTLRAPRGSHRRGAAA